MSTIPAIGFPSENPEEARLTKLSGIWLRFSLVVVSLLKLSPYNAPPSTVRLAERYAACAGHCTIWYEPEPTMLTAGESTSVALPKPFALVLMTDG